MAFSFPHQSCIQGRPSASSHNVQYTDIRLCTNPHTHKSSTENYITSLPLSGNYIFPPTVSPITPQVSFILLHQPPPSCLPLLFWALLCTFNSALICQAWIAVWTVWGGRGLQEMCVNARGTALSPTLFIFLSKWCCQEPNKISLPPHTYPSHLTGSWPKKVAKI